MNADVTNKGKKINVFAYILHSILLSVFNLVVGISAQGLNESVGNYIIFSAVALLALSALPSPIMPFTGRILEKKLLCSIATPRLLH